MKMNTLIKYFLLLPTTVVLGLFLSACAGNAGFTISESKTDSGPNYEAVRKMAIGQQWIYNVRNLYNNQIIDTITESVISVAPLIEIKRESKNSGPLPSEIQSATGLVLQDPYWNPVVSFTSPMPIWPQSSSKSERFTTQYKVLDGTSTFPWSSTITYAGSKVVNIQGNQFNTLKINNSIYFQSDDFSRHTSLRYSTIWIAPNIGRWVIKRTNGSYLDVNTGIGNDRHESMLQYELVSYK
ncbi:hypothetical protein [Polynucleobacter sp. MWH-UH25E]|uniref:hypothetical protein n=1 Tax=Polynucleobacter sp. MWH-UH25E TaxID=1855616 RepID=UPI001BFD0C8D|nr:hypothetical protein [Polynucleobacter sp. MWH-UH25E]QWD62165.1 hypothetical protein ICV39_00655 [Polynucleobacter sp. MWH-UH25E]